jgi:alpha-tubulin suppressor-like RCC1 family protein
MCWGSRLGNGTNNSSTEPVEVSGLTNVSTVAAGLNDACAVLTEGSVECWGDNTFGQVTRGQAGGREFLSPTRVPGFG